MTPDLREELSALKARQPGDVDTAALVFATKTGTPRDRHNVRTRVLVGAVKRANAKLAEAGYPPIVGCTSHSLRRTFASLLYEAGASPALVMELLGHTGASLALEVYAKKVNRARDTGERMDALVRSVDLRAQTGTSDSAEGA